MNRYFILAAAMLATTRGLAQEKGYAGLAFGFNVPTGDFASKNINNTAAGFANPGAVVDFTFGYKLGKYFGVAGLIRGQSNLTDAQAIADGLSTKMQSGVSGTVEAGNWGIGGYMLGGYGSFPVSEKLSFEARLLFGYLAATSAELRINLKGPGGAGWVKQKSVTGFAFSHLLGAGFKYDAASRICVLAHVDYMGAKPEFRNAETTTSTGETEKNTFSQTFGTVNFTLGVGYRL